MSFFIDRIQWPGDMASELGLLTVTVALLPLAGSLVAICWLQSWLWFTRQHPPTELSATQLKELQYRLREALFVDRAVRLRTAAIGYSLAWACFCLSSTVLQARDELQEQPYDPSEWDFKQTHAEYRRCCLQTHDTLRRCADRPAVPPFPPGGVPHPPSPLPPPFPPHAKPPQHFPPIFPTRFLPPPPPLLEWTVYRGKSCQTYVTDGGKMPKTLPLEEAKAACKGNTSCLAIVCPSHSVLECTLRASSKPIDYVFEDCYVYAGRSSAHLLLPFNTWEAHSVKTPPGFGHVIGGLGDEVYSASQLPESMFYGDYGVHRIPRSNNWIQAYSGPHRSTEVIVYNRFVLGKDSLGNVVRVDFRVKGLYSHRHDHSINQISAASHVLDVDPGLIASTLTHCEVLPFGSSPFCLQWATLRPLLANFIGPVGIKWMPPRPLPSLLSAAGLFFLLLALRPIDTMLVRLSCLIGAVVLGLSIANFLVEWRFVLLPLYRLGRHQGLPSQPLRALYAFAWVPLGSLLTLWAGYHFARAGLYLPPRYAIKLAWHTLGTLLRWASRVTLGYIAFDLAILWVDSGASKPQRPRPVLKAYRA